MAARRQCVTHLARNLRRGHPLHRLVFDIPRGKTTIGRPGNGHGAFAIDKGGEVFHKAELLHAGRHEFIFRQPFRQHFHAGWIVDLRFHVGVKKLAAFIAITFLKHEIAVTRLAELRRAVDTLVL